MSEGQKTKPILIKGVLLFLLICIIGITSFYTIILSWDIDCDNPSSVVTIPKGASVVEVAEILKNSTCISNKTVFKVAMQITFNDKNIIPGRYTFKGISEMQNLIKLITTPNKHRVKITLLEGWTLEQIADELKLKLNINLFKFISLCHDYNFVHSLGIDAPSLEGFLFPDTYIFLTTYTEEEIIQILFNQFMHNYNANIRDDAKSIQFSPLEAVTMASIIQGEAVFDDEMSTISSVYHNRLRKNMKLQADPTIQYIIPGKNRRLFHKDLKIDSPYNTYKYKGLPPGPINNPGISALKAAVKPKQSQYFYFVADGKGRHIFTKTNDEHNRAKRKKRKG